MENSIKSIWQEGFLKSNELIAPKVVNLYDRKSEHIIDKYKRMFKKNITAIASGAFILLFVSFLVRLQYMGVPMFFFLLFMAYVDKKLLTELEQIDKNKTSYHYLKSFDNWMDKKNTVNIKIARILYPYVFIALLMGFWHMKLKDQSMGNLFMEKLLQEFPGTSLFLGLPIWGILIVLLIVTFLFIFGARIYKWDINLVYGPIIKKLKELIADMEELREGYEL
ncbi:MAG: hypothetical protein AAFZ15_14390 [Bacteroidota bacterium]